MTKDRYASRVAWIKGLNFGGTADWAIDLDADYGANDAPGHGNSGSDFLYVSPDIYTLPNPVIQCYPPCTLVLPPFVLSTATTISMAPVTVTYEDTWSTTLTINGAVITTSVDSITSTVISLPPITTKTIYVSNVVWDPTPGPTTITTTGGNGGLTTITSTPATSSSTTGAALIWLPAASSPHR
jgi:chitinase